MKHRYSRFRSLFPLFAYCCVAPFRTAAGEPSDFERDYGNGKSLTREQEQIVLRLVNKAGITNVAKIRTYFIIPGDSVEIEVIERESIDRRSISCRVAHIGFQRWSSIEKPKRGSLKKGDFWIKFIHHENWMLLLVGSKQYRVRSWGGLSIGQAEAYLWKFLKREFEFAGNAKASEMEMANFEDPKSLSFVEKSEAPPGALIFEFRHKVIRTGGRTFCIYFKPEGSRIMILKVKEWEDPIP